MEQQSTISNANIPTSTGTSQGMPPPPAAPKRGSAVTIVGLIILILLALAAGGYYVWASGLWQSFVPQTQGTPADTSTSDIEADLQGVNVGTNAEVDSLEAQI